MHSNSSVNQLLYCVTLSLCQRIPYILLPKFLRFKINLIGLHVIFHMFLTTKGRWDHAFCHFFGNVSLLTFVCKPYFTVSMTSKVSIPILAVWWCWRHLVLENHGNREWQLSPPITHRYGYNWSHTLAHHSSSSLPFPDAAGNLALE